MRCSHIQVHFSYDQQAARVISKKINADMMRNSRKTTVKANTTLKYVIVESSLSVISVLSMKQDF